MRPTPSTFELVSPGQRVRAEVGVETVWIGSTVYPDCPVWRVWFDGRPSLDTSTLGLAPLAGEPLTCGMRPVKFSRHRALTAFGAGREARVRFAARDGREIEARVRVTDMSAFCSLRALSAKKTRRLAGTLALQIQPQTETWRASVPASRDNSEGNDLSITRFPEGSVLWGAEGQSDAQRSTLNAQLSTPDAEAEEPQVLYVPGGKVVAYWRRGIEQHLVFCDRPGDLAERRFAVLDGLVELDVRDGRCGIDLLFQKMPFTGARLPAPVFGDRVTPAYRAAFGLAAVAGGDDFWVMRGEPGQFMVAARRQGGVWSVGGLTAEPRVLTVRFEDLWLRAPAVARALRYTVKILRDPVKGEAGDRVEEAFEGHAPDLRVALDLARDGGFLLEFRGAFESSNEPVCGCS
ncbi:MAG: glycoside hydrolase family 97 C-terminal domain-containing protein [Kiritimatiellae bacterium]|nr:glycoside hydrolase family 97 C-terminal domain-containing protein [Kiritimatiellia bacterium]